MLDWLMKFLKQTFTGPSAWISILLLGVIVVAGYIIWRQFTRVQDEVSGLKKNQNDLKRQITHGVVIDDDSSRVDLKVSTRDDDSSDLSDETPDLDDRDTEHLPTQKPKTPQTQPVPSQPQAQINLQQQALQGLKTPNDAKLINAKPVPRDDIDNLSKVSSVHDDLSSISEVDDEEDIDFRDAGDDVEVEVEVEVETAAHAQAQALVPLQQQPQPQPQPQPQQSVAEDDETSELDNMSDISSVSSKIQSKILKDMQEMEADAPAPAPAEVSPKQKPSIVPVVKLGAVGQKPKPQISQSAATFKPKPTPVSIKPKVAA